jgi:CBS domain-containing protein
MGRQSLVGVIYERDCINELIVNGRSMKGIKVVEIMTRNIINISLAQTIEECLDVMTEEHIQHLPAMTDTSLFRVCFDERFIQNNHRQSEGLYIPSGKLRFRDRFRKVSE